MTINGYQEEASKMSIEGTPQWYPILGLSGEAGEILELLKKEIRDNNYLKTGVFGERIQLLMELGDALWYVAEIATRFGWSLETIAQLNLDKLQDRKERGVLHGEGDNR